MIRSAIVSLAGARLGDQSAAYLAVLDQFFDEVLRDLAAFEAIDQLRVEASFDTVADQELYSTRTMAGMSAPNYPLRVLDIWVPTWGSEGILTRANSWEEFKQFRQIVGTSSTGRFKLWQVYPNQQQVRFWPAVDSAAGNAGAGIGRMVYLAQPSAIASGAELEQIRYEDIPTIGHGLVAYGAPFRDETLLDVDRARELYEIGKRQMWGRTHNGAPGKAEPLDF